VIATGEQHTVREFVTLVAERIGLHLEWTGSGLDEKGIDQFGRVRVSVDARYFRPAEVATLLGDATRAREKLGWRPKTSFQELIDEMVDEDIASAERDELVKKHGYKIYAHQ